MTFLQDLRGFKVPLVSGVAWLVALWLWFGTHILTALGENCGRIAGPACAQQQTELTRLLVVAAEVIGKPGQFVALGTLALMFGGTVNFLSAFVLGIRYESAVPILMDWPKSDESALRERYKGEWSDVLRIRGEGVARVTLVVPLLVALAAVGYRSDPWWYVGAIPVLAVGAHGWRAIQHYMSMTKHLMAEEAGSSQTQD